MRDFPKLLKMFPKKYLLITGLILTIIISFLQLFFSLLLKSVIDTALDKNYHQFLKYIYIVFIFIILVISFTYLKTKFLGKYTETGIKSIRNKFASKMTVMDYHIHNQSHSGEYLSIGTNDINKVKGFTTSTMPDLIRVPIMGIGAMVFLLILSWKLTLISLAVIPILIIGSSVLSKPIGPISKKIQEKLGVVNTIATDFIKGVETAKAYNIETIINDSYQSAVNETVTLGKNLALKKSILEGFSIVLSIIPFIITFLLGGYFVTNNEMTIGALLAFINLLNHLTFPLSRIPVLAGDAISELVAFNRINTVFNELNERIDGEAYSFDPNKPIIEFKNVSFSYPNEQELILDKLNLIINYHESIAFVGPSGSGKSTIIKLLLGFYDNYEGEILVGGYDIKTWNLTSLRQNLSFVAQDTYLFPESIAENISYGNLNSNLIVESAKLANAHEFIMNLKHDYNTELGELGNTLSGGQKQRIAIARAIIKDAQIMIFDEPTSSLDNESEKVVQECLKVVMKNKTSLIVAHRLSTINQVDKIVVLKAGKIIEVGNHQELYQLDGLYTQLYKLQLEDGGILHE